MTVKKQQKHSKGRETGEEHNMKRFYVEYDFTESEYGRRPDMIRFFETSEEAEAFAATTADGQVGWEEPLEQKRYRYEIVETGEEICADSGDEFSWEYERRHGKGASPDGAVKITDTETGEVGMAYPLKFIG